jgi:hypothetical protein
LRREAGIIDPKPRGGQARSDLRLNRSLPLPQFLLMTPGGNFTDGVDGN